MSYHVPSGARISCWVTLSGLILVGTFCRLGGRSRWMSTAQAWKACHRHAVFNSLQRGTAVADFCPPCSSLKGCIYKVHFQGLRGPPATSVLLPFAAGRGTSPHSWCMGALQLPACSLPPARTEGCLPPAAPRFGAAGLSLSLRLLCFSSSACWGDVIPCLSTQVRDKSHLGTSVLQRWSHLRPQH